jgi:hypothetical protein
MKLEAVASVNHNSPPIFAIQWTDTNGIYPAVFYVVDDKIMKVMFGQVSQAAALGNSATGAMFDDDGSGVPYLYASFGGDAGSPKIKRMNVAGTVTTSTDVVAGLLLSLNGKAYRTIKPAGGTATCQVSVCPYGRDRFVAANWSAGTTVGFAGTDINVLTAVRNAVVAIKPEGIFAYNQTIDQWVNYTPAWRSFFHLRNGIGAFFLGDVLVVPMGDGGAVLFDGSTVRPFDPGSLMASPNRHTTSSNFTTIGAMRHWIIGSTQGPSGVTITPKMLSSPDLKFLYTTDGVSFTDASSAVNDFNLTTGTTLPSNAGLKIYLGWKYPFLAFHFATSSNNTNAVSMTIKIGTSSGFVTVGAKNVGFRDFTELNNATLGQTANVTLMTDPLALGWTKTTVNGISAYWMELSFSGALSANTTWLTCAILPYESSIDPTNFPLDGLDKAGVYPHLLYGRAIDNEPVWHDMVSFPEPDEVGAIVFSDTGGSNINRTRNLFITGRFKVWRLSTPADDRPGTEPNPWLHSHGLVESTAFEPVPGRTVRLKEVRINGYGSTRDIRMYFYYQFNEREWSRFGSAITRFPETLQEGAPGYMTVGNRFRWAIGFKRDNPNEQSPGTPVITSIEADFEVLPEKSGERPRM